jgi:hypothetical protein
MALAQLALEIAIVAATLAAAMAGVAWAWPSSLRSVSGAAVVGLVLGALFHVGFEVTGLNGAYCRVGHACVA